MIMIIFMNQMCMYVCVFDENCWVRLQLERDTHNAYVSGSAFHFVVSRRKKKYLNEITIMEQVL